MEPKILLLHCTESGSRAIQNLRQHGRSIPAGVRTFELPCSGRVNDVLLMETLETGFDGVLIVACHKDNCRYLDGNLRAEASIARIRSVLEQAGVAGKAVDMVFTSPDEGVRLAGRIETFRTHLTEAAQAGVTAT